MTAPLALLRRLRRAVRYTPLESLVGRTIVVRSAETAVVDVMNDVGGLLPISSGVCGADVHQRLGTLTKYGILDLTWFVVDRTVPVALAGLRNLRELGLLEKRSEDTLGGADTGSDLGFLNDLVDEADQGRVYLKLFLGAVRGRNDRWLAYLVDGRGPSQAALPAGGFVVEDACLTNAPSIWLLKHFYL